MAEGVVGIQYMTWGQFIVEIETASGMTGDQVTTLPYKFPCRVIDFWVIQIGAGGAGDTATLKAVATDGSTERTISDALDCNKSDKVITRMGTLDDATADLEPGECLRIETASNAVVRAYVVLARTT